MPLPHANAAPPAEQSRRMNAFLAELAPSIPPELAIEPEWKPELHFWNLWVHDHGLKAIGDYARMVEAAHQLDEKHGVDMALLPAEARDLDDDD